MPQLNATLNTRNLTRNLQRFLGDKIYVAASKAEQRTVEAAQKKAKQMMPRQLHNPTKGAINSVRRQFRQAPQIKNRQGGSKVFIAPYLVDELWKNTVTEQSNRPKLDDKSPDGARSGVVVPSKRLRNNAGNLRGFRNGRLGKLRDNPRYFEVTQENTVKGSRGFLKRGIYQVYGGARNRKIRIVVEYQDIRYITPKYKFRQIVLDEYSAVYADEMNKAMAEEVRKLVSRG